MRISDWSSDVCSSYLHLAIQCIVGAKRDFAFLSQPLGEPEGQRTGCRAGRVDVGKDEIAAEMPLGKACTGSNRQPGRQIVGRAELIDVVIPPAESCLLARSEEHTSELQVTNAPLVCRLLLEKKKNTHKDTRLQ